MRHFHFFSENVAESQPRQNTEHFMYFFLLFSKTFFPGFLKTHHYADKGFNDISFQPLAALGSKKDKEPDLQNVSKPKGSPEK